VNSTVRTFSADRNVGLVKFTALAGCSDAQARS
jgi:hypothetical protein